MTEQVEQVFPAKPLITESSTSESTTVEVAMNDMDDGMLYIPDYRRDSDQVGSTIEVVTDRIRN